MIAAWLALTAGLCLVTGFVYYWTGVRHTERRFAADFDATFDAYAQVKRERDGLVACVNDLIDGAGVLTPAERDTFDKVVQRLGAA